MHIESTRRAECSSCINRNEIRIRVWIRIGIRIKLWLHLLQIGARLRRASKCVGCKRSFDTHLTHPTNTRVQSAFVLKQFALPFAITLTKGTRLRRTNAFIVLNNQLRNYMYKQVHILIVVQAVSIRVLPSIELRSLGINICLSLIFRNVFTGLKNRLLHGRTFYRDLNSSIKS